MKQIIDAIKWKLFMWKIRLPLVKYNIRDKYLRRKYYRYGLHKLITGSLTIKEHKKRTVHIRYLACHMCNYKFFARKIDKENYIKHDQRSSSALQKALKNLKSELD